MASSALQPKSCSAAGFHNLTVPSRSSTTMASGDASTSARKLRCEVECNLLSALKSVVMIATPCSIQHQYCSNDTRNVAGFAAIPYTTDERLLLYTLHPLIGLKVKILW